MQRRASITSRHKRGGYCPICIDGAHEIVPILLAFQSPLLEIQTARYLHADSHAVAKPANEWPSSEISIHLGSAGFSVKAVPNAPLNGGPRSAWLTRLYQ